MAETRGPQISANAWAFVVLSSIATLLRIYCRGWVIKSFGLDDWLAVAAQILFLVFSSYEITGVTYGTGHHFADIPTESFSKAMQMWWTCEPTYVLTNMAIKASIAIFLSRICIEKFHKIIIWSILALTEVYSLFFFLLFVLQCRPTALFWLRYTLEPPAGMCLDATIVAKSFYGYSAISCLTDWTYSLLPIMLVWNLQMNMRMKISVVLLLAAGVIATIVRFPYLYSLTDVDDFLYSTSDVAIWSTVETGIAITTAGLATLRPLFRSVFGLGSSAPGAGTSAQQQGYLKTNSQSRRTNRTGGGGGTRSNNDDHDGGAFDLYERPVPSSKMGVTTFVNYGREDPEKGTTFDGKSVASSSVHERDDWDGSSQADLAQKRHQPERSGWNITVKNPVNLAILALHDADYAYIQSDGNAVHVQAMTACCAPQPAHQDGCYTWCRLPAGDDIDAPESQLSWERGFQYCLNYQGRLASDGGGRFRAPWVRAVHNKREEKAAVSAAAASRRHMGEVGVVKRAATFLVLGVLSWAFA
ncbi:hypothetical protein PG994_009311 [Apiospora phragmitis]|uniref:Rhodopsin domain-containing protein n=1 Tax=Apiospora phragmitis TaxID=2905665 RepID=A0ABR1ULT3_9PEZI